MLSCITCMQCRLSPRAFPICRYHGQLESILNPIAPVGAKSSNTREKPMMLSLKFSEIFCLFLLFIMIITLGLPLTLIVQ